MYANLKSIHLENIQNTFSIYYARQINFLKNSQSIDDGIIVKNVNGCHIQDDNTNNQYTIFKDEHYVSDSVQNANQIILLQFIVTTLQAKKKYIFGSHIANIQILIMNQ